MGRSPSNQARPTSLKRVFASVILLVSFLATNVAAADSMVLALDQAIPSLYGVYAVADLLTLQAKTHASSNTGVHLGFVSTSVAGSSAQKDALILSRLDTLSSES